MIKEIERFKYFENHISLEIIFEKLSRKNKILKLNFIIKGGDKNMKRLKNDGMKTLRFDVSEKEYIKLIEMKVKGKFETWRSMFNSNLFLK